MRKLILVILALALAAGLSFLLVSGCPRWEGVDTTVVEKYAIEAGRPPRKPYIDTDRGDLLLFFFLVAGAAGGFVGGYYFRELFPPKPKINKE